TSATLRTPSRSSWGDEVYYSSHTARLPLVCARLATGVRAFRHLHTTTSRGRPALTPHCCLTSSYGLRQFESSCASSAQYGPKNVRRTGTRRRRLRTSGGSRPGRRLHGTMWSMEAALRVQPSTTTKAHYPAGTRGDCRTLHHDAVRLSARPDMDRLNPFGR